MTLTKNQNIGSDSNDPDLRARFDEVVSALFARMDADEDQTVDKTEFVEQYYQEYTQLQEEIEELELRIKDQNQRSAQIEQRLVEMRRMEKKSKNMHPVF